jgi:hypothetical protein
MKKLLGLAVMLFAVVGLSFGQATSVNGGSIQGSITDPSGAVVSGASVTITGIDTGSVKTVTTDSAGFYSVGPLNPGNYNVTVVLTGFQKLSVKTVVRTGTVTTGSYKMIIGQSSETVEVNAGALQVNTEQAGVSGVVTREQIDSLPINGRNFLDVAQVQPGVILQSGETFDPTKAGYSAISVGGVSGRTTRILLDGQDITDETVGTTIMNVTTGAIDEFQLNRSTQDVSGEVTSTGQVLVSTQSGTNTFHGQLFYNFQDYRSGFAATTGGLSSPFQRNQFGGGVGGPIIKDKLFFFGDIERIKQDESGAASTSPTFAAIQAKYPSIPAPFRDTYSTLRADYQGPKGVHLFARAAYDVNADSSNFALLYSLYQTRNNVPALVGGADFTTGRFTHSFRGGYEKFHNLLGDGTGGAGSSIYNPLPTGGPSGAATLFDPNDGFFAGPNYLAPQQTYQSDKQLRYDGTWTKGAHSIKFGASMNRILGGGFAAFFGPSLFTQFGGAQLLSQCYDPSVSGPCPGDPVNGYSSQLYDLGNGNGFSSERTGFKLPGGGLEDWRSGAYVGDTWKAAPYLTVVAGLRWSVDTDRANQDLATPLCSSVDSSLQFPGCTGNTPLFDQFQQGLGVKTHQPYGNFGPQAGFVFSPGNHNTSIRGGIGIFYESDIFNNTGNARSAIVQAPGLYFGQAAICSGTYAINIPGMGTVTTTPDGTPLTTICSEPIAQAVPQVNALKAEYQAASQTGGPNPSYIGLPAGGLKSPAGGMYGGPYLTPYSIQFNGGIQHEIRKGMILSVDYVHNATIKTPLAIDVNHVGAARFLNKAAAQTAITNTLAYCNAPSINAAMGPNGCAPSATPTSGAPAPFSANITTFAAQGLDSGNQYSGGNAYTAFGQSAPAAFAGANPNVGLGQFVLPAGRSGYDALQVVFQEQKAHPAPGIMSSNFQASYSLSRVVGPVANNSTNSGNTADQFFNSAPWDYDNPNEFQGRTNLDHTNELSFGGSFGVKYGLNVGVIGHFYSAPPTNLVLDATSGAPGEIFRTDVTGDGTTGDIVPGTLPGYYMHQIKGAGLNKLINNYNATMAGQPTPAGQALIAAGLLTQAQLVGLNAVQQQIATAPTNPIPNAAFRDFDLSANYPIRLSRLREGLSIEPGVAMYNVTNMSNFNRIAPLGVLASVNTANGPVNSLTGFVNGPNNQGVLDGARTQRGSGTFDQGAPRTTEFQLKVNF